MGRADVPFVNVVPPNHKSFAFPDNVSLNRNEKSVLLPTANNIFGPVPTRLNFVTNIIDHDVEIVRFELATISGVFDAAKLTAGNPPSELLWIVPNDVVKFKF